MEAILDAALRVPADVRLGINVHASSLAMDGGFIDFLGASLEASRSTTWASAIPTT